MYENEVECKVLLNIKKVCVLVLMYCSSFEYVVMEFVGLVVGVLGFVGFFSFCLEVVDKI